MSRGEEPPSHKIKPKLSLTQRPDTQLSVPRMSLLQGSTLKANWKIISSVQHARIKSNIQNHSRFGLCYRERELATERTTFSVRYISG